MPEVHHFRHHVLVLRHAAGAAVEDVREVLLAQTLERVSDLVFGVRRDGVAVVLLIAGKRERVESQWIVLGCGHLFLDQRPQDARLDVG